MKNPFRSLNGIDFDKFVHLSLSRIILIFAPQPKVNHWVNTSRERAFQGLGKRLWRSKGASPGEFRVTSYNEKNQGTGDKILFTSRNVCKKNTQFARKKHVPKKVLLHCL